MRITPFLMLVLLSWQAGADDFSAAAETLTNGRVVAPALISAGQPDAEQLKRLAEAGLAAVINLRTPGEDPGFDEAALLRDADVAYYHVPVAGSAGLTEANAARLDRLLQRHAGQPVLVHCASGNRVGALFALRAHTLQGLPADEALEQGRAAGLTGLESAVGGLLSDE